ncbi:MAG: efflux RND transporter permease subunit, partial [Gammaproteobacteria bacterium]|nr:efflux RND transporter permease subunit [Gammaproteobacteria bacterium]NIW42288.1 hypothetical protein [candidate division Zixibacteria bacterium]NIX56911.1 hypothetical protein [candidate division Zixibacteria bacterium]
RIRYLKEYRNSVQQLKNLYIKGSEGMSVPLSSLAEIGYQSSAGVIKRQDLARGVEVWADFKPDIDNKTQITSEIKDKIDAISLPAGYTVGAG